VGCVQVAQDTELSPLENQLLTATAAGSTDEVQRLLF
jgi:hypothetical protein